MNDSIPYRPLPKIKGPGHAPIIPSVAELKRSGDYKTTGSAMTPQQIKNWRTFLLSHVGPFAMFCPESDIYKVRDIMQKDTGVEWNPASDAQR